MILSFFLDPIRRRRTDGSTPPSMGGESAGCLADRCAERTSGFASKLLVFSHSSVVRASTSRFPHEWIFVAPRRRTRFVEAAATKTKTKTMRRRRRSPQPQRDERRRRRTVDATLLVRCFLLSSAAFVASSAEVPSSILLRCPPGDPPSSARDDDRILAFDVRHPRLEALGLDDDVYEGLAYEAVIATADNGSTLDAFLVQSVEARTGRPIGRFEPSDVSSVCPPFGHVALSRGPLARVLLLWTPENLDRADAVNITAYALIAGRWYRKSILLRRRNDGCHRYASSDRGTLTEADFPPNCSNPVVIVEVPEEHAVHLRFQSVHLLSGKWSDCGKEYIEVSVADVQRAWSSEKVCGYLDDGGRKLRRLRFVARREALVLRVKLREGSAFEATHFALDLRKGCNGTATATSGSVSSPGFPDGHPSGADCQMTIAVPENHTLALRLRRLDLRPASCDHDFLLLLASPDERRFCGPLAASERTLYASDDALVRFHGARGGFLLDYSLLSPGCEAPAAPTSDGRVVLGTDATDAEDGWQVRCAALRAPTAAPAILQLRRRSVVGPADFRLTADADAKATALNAMRCVDGFLEAAMDDGSSWVSCDPPSSVDVSLAVRAGGAVLLRLVRPSAVLRPALVLDYSFRPADPCDEGWVAASPNRCYLMVEEPPRRWTEAGDFCRTLGARLVSVDDRRTQLFLDALMAGSRSSSSSKEEDVAFWTGANDRLLENAFEWDDGGSVSYTNWFKGWRRFNGYNRQPSDDGLSEQDCVEMRRSFPFPTKGAGSTEGFFWNDRDCSVSNPFICQKLQFGAAAAAAAISAVDCNRTVVLTLRRPSDVVSSPGYPARYPNDAECTVVVEAPPGYRVVVTFSAFVLEQSDPCQYDYLQTTSSSEDPTRFCGDWSGRLKFLRQKSAGNRIAMKFVSDQSHAYAGFVADVRIEEERQRCEDDRHGYGGHCYWIVTSPAVTWYAANQQCALQHSRLSSVGSPEEESFLAERLREEGRSTDDPFFWLGAFEASPSGAWAWTDSSSFSYAEKKMESSWAGEKPPPETCLSLQRLEGDGVRWVAKECHAYGGFVCKKKEEALEENLNDTLRDEAGNVSSPSFPSPYANDLHYTVAVLGPPKTRIAIDFLYLDLEWQEECLYDYVALYGSEPRDAVRLCGSDGKRDEEWEYVSEANVARLTFHSDYSESGGGFLARYKAVDVSGCPRRTLTRSESGVLSSVNYPDPYLNSMDCETTVEAPPERWLWLRFESFSVGSADGDLCADDYVELSFSPVRLCGDLTHQLHNMGFLIRERTFRLHFHSDGRGRFRGFLAQYAALLSPTVESIATLRPNSFGPIRRLNYPSPAAPAGANVTRQLVVPPGYVLDIRVEWTKNASSSFGGCDDWRFELSDPYLSDPPTVFCPLEAADVSPRTVRSRFNVLAVRELTGNRSVARHDVAFRITYGVVKDPLFLNKTSALGTTAIPFCHPYACLNGGRCSRLDAQNVCRCSGHYKGVFCHLTECDFNPCVFGTCNLTAEGHSCLCTRGYGGVRCENKVNPCGQNPCGTRGVCMVQNDRFVCRCHIWYQGAMCEQRAAKIPYRPLSKRMLEEPFWLGLITVFVVLIVLGLVWCIKRKFADKLEKFISEEIEKSKQNQSCKSSKRHSIRDQGSPVSLSPQTCPKSLFSRIGLRKHSMLSLDSGGSSPNYHENRSFSFDDIMKKGDSQKKLDKRCQSPVQQQQQQLDKKELLHSLVAPPPLGSAKGRRMSLDEFIQMSEKKILERKSSRENASSDGEGASEETSFGNAAAANRQAFKKRVNFVRTLEKIDSVSFENEREEDPAEGATPTGLNRDDFCVGRNSADVDRLSDTGSSCSSKASGLYEIPESLFSDCSATDSEFKRNGARRTHRRSDSTSEEADNSWASSDLLKNAAKSEVRAEIHEAPNDSEAAAAAAIVANVHTESKFGAEPPPWVKRCSDADPEERFPTEDRLFLKPPFDVVEEAVRQSSAGMVPRWYHEATPGKAEDPFDPSAARTAEKTRDFRAIPNHLSVKTVQTFHELLPKLHPLGRPGSPIPGPRLKMPAQLEAQYSFDAAAADRTLRPDKEEAVILRTSPSAPRSEKACSLFPAPVITITATSNASSCESDTDSPTKTTARTMHYLSPFDVIRQGSAERSTSLSNLSSSGYSSMASPGPSRCNSNSPLFGADADGEPPGVGPPYGLSPTNLGRRHILQQQQQQQQQHRPPGPGLLLPFQGSSPKRHPGGMPEAVGAGVKRSRPPLLRAVSVMRKRSDSETTDEQPEPSGSHEDSNDDEGIGMDHIDLKIRHGEVTSAEDLELYMDGEMGPPPEAEPAKAGRCPLQDFVCPAIVVQTLLRDEADGKDRCWKFARRTSFQRKLSPVSSRSESPMSDRGCQEKCPAASVFGGEEGGYGDLEDAFARSGSEANGSSGEPKPPPPSAQQRKPTRRKDKSKSNSIKHRLKSPAEASKDCPSSATGSKKSPMRRIRVQNSMDADSSSSDSSSRSGARVKDSRSANVGARTDCSNPAAHRKRNVPRCDSLPLPLRKPVFGIAANRPDVTRVGASSMDEWPPLSCSGTLERDEDDEVFEEPGCRALEDAGYSAVDRWKVDRRLPDVCSETSEFSEEDSGSEVSFYLRKNNERAEKGESRRLLSPARSSPDMAIICYSGGGFGRKCSEDDD